MNGIIDPAWFYSSLAQASAAIVGLVGAVLGSRILDHVTLMRTERKEVDRFIGAVRQTLDARAEEWRTFRQYLDREIQADKQALSEGKVTRDVNEAWTFGSRSRIGLQATHVTPHLQDLEQNLSTLERVSPCYGALPTGGLEIDALPGWAARLRTGGLELFPESHPTRTQLVSDAALLVQLFEETDRFRRRVIPKAFVVVLVLLLVLAATGIVWPLATLPGLPGSTKCLMMLGLVVGVFGLLSFFGYQLYELKRLVALSWLPR
ncbi:MAG TPA: hypothetical protein VGQ18_03035 [Gemmatimonadales bacterium]|jgi:hypothetical protein|nr:hypothetical protein [Gemmatimonadales bacterium]